MKTSAGSSPFEKPEACKHPNLRASDWLCFSDADFLATLTAGPAACAGRLYRAKDFCEQGRAAKFEGPPISKPIGESPNQFNLEGGGCRGCDGSCSGTLERVPWRCEAFFRPPYRPTPLSHSKVNSDLKC